MKKGLTVIKRAVMPDGTHIQLESWGRNDGTGDIEIGAYPVCKESLEPFRKKNETFRLSLTRIPEGAAGKLFLELIDGKKTLADCMQYFYRPNEDAYCLGLRDELAA